MDYSKQNSMYPQEHYNLIVIGAGPGGYEAAVKAAKAGLKTLLIDKAHAGGTCLNKGCIPTKTLLHSGKLFYEMMHSGAEIGINADALSFDMPKIYENKNSIVQKIRNGLALLFKQNKINFINATAQIVAKNTVAANGNIYTADNILIATGSVPALPPIKGIDFALTSDDVLKDSAADFKSVVLIGGGVIGCEFASFYNYLGKKVCIIEAAERILLNMDKEVSQNLAMIFKKRGIDIQTGAKLNEIAKDGAQIVCRFETYEGGHELRANAVIVATGRKPYTDGLFGDGFKVNMTARNFIVVDKNFCTSAEGVYAIGDVTGGMMLAHAATAQGEVAVDHMLGKDCTRNINSVPACVYTSPEIACVGMTADEARAQGIEVKILKYSMLANGKSLIEREERGFVKLVFDAQSGKMVGATLMCGRASDIISIVTLAVANGMTEKEFKVAVLPHPTFCEAINDALKG